MAVIGEAVVRFLADTAEFRTKVSGAAGSMRAAGEKMEEVGGKLTRKLTLPLLAAGAAATAFAVDFQSGMANVATLIPGSTARIEELGEAVKEMGIETGKSLGDLTGGLFETISAFGDTADTVEILRINAMAAAAGLAQTKDALNLTSAVTKVYGDTSAEAVGKVADLSLLAVRLGQTTFPELAASIGNVTPFAAELRVTQEELFGAMATFTGVTGGAAEVSTQLKGALAGLLAPMPAMTEHLENMGVESGKALIEQRGLQGALKSVTDAATESGMPLKKYFESIEAQTFALAAAGGQADAFQEKTAAMSNALGTTQVAFDEQTTGINATGFALQQAKTEMQVAGVEIGQVLLPALVSVVNVITPLISGFTELTPPMQSAVVVTAALVAGLGPLLTIGGNLLIIVGKMPLLLGSMASALTTVTTATIALVGVTGLVLIALVAVGLAVNAVIQNWDVLAFEAGRLWEGIKSVFRSGVETVKNFIGDFVEGITDKFGWLFDILVGRSIVPDLMKAIGEEFDGLENLMVAPADEAARKVNEAFRNIVNPEALKEMDFAVSIDASELYAAVIEATGSAAVAIKALQNEVTPTAEAMELYREEIEADRVAAVTWLSAMTMAERSTRNMDFALKDMNLAVVQVTGTTGELDLAQLFLTDATMALGDGEQKLNEATGELEASTISMSESGKAAMDLQVQALRENETALRLHKFATDTMSMATDMARHEMDALQRSAAGVIADFTPMGLLATVFGAALEALRPAIEALQAPLQILGTIIASAVTPIIKALFPVIKILAIAASFVVEGFLFLAGWTAKITGWLIEAIGSFVFAVGKALSKIPFLGKAFNSMRDAGKQMRDFGKGVKATGQDLLDAIPDVRAGREEIRALEWPEEAVNAAGAQREATEGTTGAVDVTNQSVREVGSQLLDVSTQMLENLVSIRELAFQGVDFLAILAGSGGLAAPGFGMATSLAPAAAGVSAGDGGTRVDMAPGSVVIQTGGPNAEEDGRAAARGFTDELNRKKGDRFNREKRFITKSGRLDSADRIV